VAPATRRLAAAIVRKQTAGAGHLREVDGALLPRPAAAVPALPMDITAGRSPPPISIDAVVEKVAATTTQASCCRPRARPPDRSDARLPSVEAAAGRPPRRPPPLRRVRRRPTAVTPASPRLRPLPQKRIHFTSPDTPHQQPLSTGAVAIATNGLRRCRRRQRCPPEDPPSPTATPYSSLARGRGGDLH
jgi:hypothetical protein